MLSTCLLYVTAMSSLVYAEQIRIGVADFVDRTNSSHSSPNSMREVTDIFTKILASYSNNMEVTNSKSFQALNGVTTDNFANAGKSAGCQYVVLGALTKGDIDFSHSYKESGFLVSISTIKDTIYTYTANLDVRVIEVNTGKIIFSSSGTGQSSYSKDVKEATKNAYSQKEIQKTLNEQEKIKGQALSKASSMTAEKIYTFLTGEYPEISSIKANTPPAKKSKRKTKKIEKNASLGTVTINYGTSVGVNEKTFYKIFFEGEEVHDFSGNSLGREKFNIAIAEVNNAKTDYSIASVTGGIFENIRTGDKAEQITQEEAQAIIERNDFAKNRISEFLR